MKSVSIEQFKRTLEANHSWPGIYTFKFIGPRDQKENILNLFEENDKISIRRSKNGRYIGITAKCKVFSSQEVISVYESAAQIKGLIAL